MATEKINVTMKDGSIIAFSPKSKIRANVILDTDGAPTGLQFACINGEQLRVDFNDLAQQVKIYAPAHGIKQKLLDSFALRANVGTDNQWIALQVMAAQLRHSWNVGRTTGNVKAKAEAVIDTGALATAMLQLFPDKTEDAIKTLVEAFTEPERNKLAHSPKVLPLYYAAVAAKTAEDPEAEDLLTVFED